VLAVRRSTDAQAGALHRARLEPRFWTGGRAHGSNRDKIHGFVMVSRLAITFSEERLQDRSQAPVNAVAGRVGYVAISNFR
jgi:hypothetical protein